MSHLPLTQSHAASEKEDTGMTQQAQTAKIQSRPSVHHGGSHLRIDFSSTVEIIKHTVGKELLVGAFLDMLGTNLLRFFSTWCVAPNGSSKLQLCIQKNAAAASLPPDVTLEPHVIASVRLHIDGTQVGRKRYPFLVSEEAPNSPPT